MKNLSSKAFQTRAVHAGERTPSPDYTPVATPIWPAVGYLYDIGLRSGIAVFHRSRIGFPLARRGTDSGID